MKFLKIIFISVFLYLVSIYFSDVGAQTLTISPDPPFAEPTFSCNNPLACFIADGLDPSVAYRLDFECINCSTAGLPFHSYDFPTGNSTAWYCVTFNPNGVCPNPPDLVVEVDQYFASLINTSTGDIADEDFFNILESTCTLTPNYPIIQGQPATISLNTSFPSTGYSAQIFPVCLPSDLSFTTQPDGSATINIPVSCTESFTGSRQISVIGDPTNPDHCWTAFHVGDVAPTLCVGDSGEQGICYSEDDYGSCRPPSDFFGQRECPAGELCCLPSDRTGFPPGEPCVGRLSSLPGTCHFLFCDPRVYFPDGWNPQTPNGLGPACSDDLSANMLYVCCVPWPESHRVSRPQLDSGCTASDDSQGIDTAIGCIPVTSSTGLVAFILRFGIGIGGGIAFLLVLFSALQIITSGGNPEKLKAGKELLSASIGGLLLIIFSVFILELIGVRILHLPGF